MFSESRERFRQQRRRWQQSNRLIRFLSSIRFRLTAIFVIILSATLVFFSLLLYQVFTRNHIREFDAALYNYTVDVSNSIQVNFFGDLRFRPYVPFDEKKAFPFGLGQAFFQVTDMNGVPIARSGNLGMAILSVNREEIAKLLRDEVIFDSIPSATLPPTADREAKYYRAIKFLVKLSNGTNTILFVAVPMTLFEKESKGLIGFLWIFVPILIFGATLGGWFFAGSALKPIKLINASARRISAMNLSTRLPVPETDDEISHLSQTLNELLGRIERAFTSQERFIADVSHEMKTPLAIMRGEFDFVKKRTHDEELRHFVESADQEIAHLSQLVENLLVLARVDAGVSALNPAKVRLDEVILESVVRAEVVAKRSGSRLSVNMKENTSSDASQQFVLEGDAGLLQVLVKNLIENAIKFSNAGEPVEVELEDRDEEIVLRVRDRGKGIPEEEQQKIFERFYRVESVKNETRGSGLGLHLVERIADIHGGSIMVDSQLNVGTNFEVTLPKTYLLASA